MGRSLKMIGSGGTPSHETCEFGLVSDMAGDRLQDPRCLRIHNFGGEEYAPLRAALSNRCGRGGCGCQVNHRSQWSSGVVMVKDHMVMGDHTGLLPSYLKAPFEVVECASQIL